MSIAYIFSFEYEDFPNIKFEVKFKSTQTLEELHDFFLSYTKYDKNVPASIFDCNENWVRGKEYHSQKIKNDKKLPMMADYKLSHIINDPHQKLYYIYYFEKPLFVKIQLVKMKRVSEEATFPQVLKDADRIPTLFHNIKPENADCQINSELLKLENILGKTDDELEPTAEDLDMLEEDVETDEFEEEAVFSAEDESLESNFSTIEGDNKEDNIDEENDNIYT